MARCKAGSPELGKLGRAVELGAYWTGGLSSPDLLQPHHPVK